MIYILIWLKKFISIKKKLNYLDIKNKKYIFALKIILNFRK